MQVRSLGWEDPLEKRMATHSSILAWEILWTEEPGSPRVAKSWTLFSNETTTTALCSRARKMLETRNRKDKSCSSFISLYYNSGWGSVYSGITKLKFFSRIEINYVCMELSF